MADAPKGLTSIPAGLDAETIAKLFFVLSVEEKNEAVWKELLSNNWFDIFKNKEGVVTDKRPRANYTSAWRSLNDGRTFTFEKAGPESAEEKKFFFTYTKDGNSKPGLPVKVVFQNNEWRVEGAQLF